MPLQQLLDVHSFAFSEYELQNETTGVFYKHVFDEGGC